MEDHANSESGEVEVGGGGVLTEGEFITAGGEQQYVLFARQADQIPDPATLTAENVIAALAFVRAQLVELRGQRNDINAVIRERVAQEAFLERMARIATEMLKGGEEVEAEGADGGPTVDA